jgi:hypothetical protein
MAINRTPYSVAQETLGMSSMQRGLGGMTSPVRPGPNAYDGLSNPAVQNYQEYQNQRLAQQDMRQNIGTAAPQAAADAMGKVRSQTAMQSDANSRAQSFASQRLAEALYANDLGTDLMRLNAKIHSPEKANFLHSVAVAQATSAGMNPDLAGEVFTKNLYNV